MSKHRTTIYAVLRSDGTLLDSFRTYEAADNRAGALAQEYLDKHINGFTFSVQASTFYDL